MDLERREHTIARLLPVDPVIEKDRPGCNPFASNAHSHPLERLGSDRPGIKLDRHGLCSCIQARLSGKLLVGTAGLPLASRDRQGAERDREDRHEKARPKSPVPRWAVRLDHAPRATLRGRPTTAPRVRVFVIIVLLLILGSLGSALYFMMTDRGQSNRTVWALTIRVGLSVGLFLVLMAGYYFGFIPKRL